MSPRALLLETEPKENRRRVNRLTYLIALDRERDDDDDVDVFRVFLEEVHFV